MARKLFVFGDDEDIVIILRIKSILKKVVSACCSEPEFSKHFIMKVKEFLALKYDSSMKKLQAECSNSDVILQRAIYKVISR